MTDQKPVPTHTSDLINDAGFITESKFKWDNIANKPVLANVATSGSFVDLSDKPRLSQLENDCNFPVDGKVLWDNVQGKPTFFSGNYLDLENRPVVFSGSYNDLKDKPQVFSGSYYDLVDTPALFDGNYNSLSNTPTLFSGQYKDLIGVPALFSGQYKDLIGAPTLFSGNYDDLENKPTLFSGNYDDLENKPTLFSGNYTDLIDPPSLFSGNYTDLIGVPTLFSGNYDDLENKPTLFSGNYDDLNHIPPMVADEWNSEQVKYLPGSYVIFEGTAFCCIAENDSMPTDNEKFWKKLGKGFVLPVAEAPRVVQDTLQVAISTSKLTVQELTQLSVANMILDPAKVTGDILTVFPTNDRTIMIPAASTATAGLRYIIRNRSFDSEITLKLQETQAVFVVIAPVSHCEIVCDGHDWFTLN